MRAEIDSIISSVDKDIEDEENIKSIILDYFGVSREGFESAQRVQSTRVIPRDFYFFFGKALLNISLERLGKNAGDKNHATALHGINNIINWLEYKDKEITGHYDYLYLVFERRGYDMSLIPKFVEEQKAKQRSSLKNLKRA